IEMGGNRGAGEIVNLVRFRQLDAIRCHFPTTNFGDFGGDLLQPTLVAIRERQVAAPFRKLQRQRAADSARCPGQSGGGSTDGSHQVLQKGPGSGQNPGTSVRAKIAPYAAVDNSIKPAVPS